MKHNYICTSRSGFGDGIYKCDHCGHKYVEGDTYNNKELIALISGECDNLGRLSVAADGLEKVIREIDTSCTPEEAERMLKGLSAEEKQGKKSSLGEAMLPDSDGWVDLKKVGEAMFG